MGRRKEEVGRKRKKEGDAKKIGGGRRRREEKRNFGGGRMMGEEGKRMEGRMTEQEGMGKNKGNMMVEMNAWFALKFF